MPSGPDLVWGNMVFSTIKNASFLFSDAIIKDREEHYMGTTRIAIIYSFYLLSSTSTMAHILSSVSGAIIDLQPVRRALLSVSDKTGLIEIATVLSSLNVELLSTGGTAKAIRDAGFNVIDVSDYTGSPEILVSIDNTPQASAMQNDSMLMPTTINVD